MHRSLADPEDASSLLRWRRKFVEPVYSAVMLDDHDWVLLVEAMDSRERALMERIALLEQEQRADAKRLRSARAAADDALARVQNLEALMHARGLA